MRVAFAGTPAFAASALSAIAAAGMTVPLVLTRPDRPAGRGLGLQPSVVKALALTQGWPLAQPRGLRLDGRFADDAETARQRLVAAAPDVLVVAAYGLILPPWVLALPRLGGVNIHASLLPRWRGAAPIQRAIEGGDSETGITIMQMDEGLDTGPMLLWRAEPIGAGDTAGSLHDRLAALGAQLVVGALRQLATGTATPTAQPPGGVTYAAKVDKAEAALDWRLPAAQLERRVRAFDPAPGATAAVGDQTLKVWQAAVVPGKGRPGERLAHPGRLVVACGEGALELLKVQRAGGRRQPAAAFVQGERSRRGPGGR